MDINSNNNLQDNELEKSSEENNDVEFNTDNKSIKSEEIKSNKMIKNHNRKSYTLITILLLLIFSIVSVGSYVPLKNIYIPNENEVETYVRSSYFQHTLGRFANYLYNSKILEQDWYDPRYENVESVKYYITSTDNTINISNIKDFDNEKLEQELNDSIHFIVIEFDINGEFNINSSLGVNQNSLIGGLINSNEEDLSKYSDLKVFYIIPENFKEYKDFFTYSMQEKNIDNYLILILIIGGISILLLLIIAFSMPYEIQRKTTICKSFNRLFLEFKPLIWLLFFLPTILGIQVISRHYGYSPYNTFNLVETIYEANEAFYILGIPITFILYMLIYLTIVDIKHAYHIGFKEFFIENSITGRIVLKIFKGLFKTINKLRSSVKKVISIDITKDYNKKILILLIINLLILWLIALGGGFMIILAIGYSVFLFNYFVNYMSNLEDIHEVSCQLANGDFNINLKEDMGMLSPIAENLNNIKEGFKLAIDKEIQSQRMKAELISNVSHDLKTPLTSIITYIDLLKKEDNSKEERTEYIGILDKKSKRLKVLIEDLFEASKASSGNIDLYLESIDVVALFRQTLGELEERIKESSLVIKTSLPENKVICELDGKRTYRIFENVMNNIFKYAMESSRVYIDVIEDDNEVSFTFKNISSYEMNFDVKEITERFARGDKSRSTEGSGLGLSIAKSFVEIQNGNLDIVIDGDLFKLIITFPKKRY